MLGGVSVFEDQAANLTRDLDNLAASFSAADPASIEFHASEVFSRRSSPWKDLSREEAQGVIKAVLRLVARSHVTTRLFACAIHKGSFAGEDPVERCFEDICKRFDLFLARMANDGDRQRGLLILDKSTRETSLQGLSREFRSRGTRWGVVRNLADTPFFVDSRASRTVQAADLIAYAVFRRYNAGDSQYFDLIASRFDSVDNVVHGLAHLTREKGPTCICLACHSRRMAKSAGNISEAP